MNPQVNENEKPNVHVLILGLDDAGKTTILYKIKDGRGDPNTITTIGYNVESIEFEDKNYTFWDIGGLDTVRVLWKFYAENKGVVIFVVDASNPTRFEEAKDFLHTIMSHEALNNAMLLIISNKHDKANCITNDELKEELNLGNIKQSIRIANTSAIDPQSINNIMLQLKCVN